MIHPTVSTLMSQIRAKGLAHRKDAEPISSWLHAMEAQRRWGYINEINEGYTATKYRSSEATGSDQVMAAKSLASIAVVAFAISDITSDPVEAVMDKTGVVDIGDDASVGMDYDADIASAAALTDAIRRRFGMHIKVAKMGPSGNDIPKAPHPAKR